MAQVSCINCGKPYPAFSVPFRCPDCGGLFDWSEFPTFVKTKVDPTIRGIRRYQPMLGLADNMSLVTLGEGNTPLISDSYQGHKIALKLESLNPTGSYKDRGSAVLISFLVGRGVLSAVEDSSGNAGASFAAYASRAGIKARIFLPGYASGPKRRQIEAYGAEIVTINGPRSAAAEAVRREAEQGAVYASHAFLPFGMPGIATIAYEIVDQLGSVPGTVIAPVGHGSLLLGIMRGFTALKQAELIQDTPYYIGVQASACAPVWAEFSGQTGEVNEGDTLAEGVRVRYPLRGKAILSSFDKYRDNILAIEEKRIIVCRNQLALRGIYVEPTSALVWAALEESAGKVPDPIVLICSGSGLKYNQ
jgi:threonine synthase